MVLILRTLLIFRSAGGSTNLSCDGTRIGYMIDGCYHRFSSARVMHLCIELALGRPDEIAARDDFAVQESVSEKRLTILEIRFSRRRSIAEAADVRVAGLRHEFQEELLLAVFEHSPLFILAPASYRRQELLAHVQDRLERNAHDAIASSTMVHQFPQRAVNGRERGIHRNLGRMLLKLRRTDGNGYVPT